MHAKRILYLNINVLQVLPPSCINRDDTGSPKSCMYGGVPRLRGSSQSLKRAARLYMQSHFGDAGIRTKKIIAIIARALAKNAGCESKLAEAFVRKCLSDAGIVSEKEDAKETAAFFSKDQVDALAGLICDYYKGEGAALAESLKDPKEKDLKKGDPKEKGSKKGDSKKDSPKISSDFKKELLAAAKEKPSDSQLLFGRMFASNQSLDFDAACQVAQGISVDEVREEVDYFTAVGDKEILRDTYGIEEDHGGSDYIDSKYFNSGTIYKYANVNLSEGSELDQTDAANAAAEFLEAIVMSMPSGSINSNANMTVPETVIVELMERPINYAPAFLRPVKGNEEKSVAEVAEERLRAYMAKCDAVYGEPIARWEFGKLSMKELCSQIREEIAGRM